MLSRLGDREIDDVLQQGKLLLDPGLPLHAVKGGVDPDWAIIRDVLDHQAVVAVPGGYVLVVGPVFPQKKEEKCANPVFLLEPDQFVIDVKRVLVQAEYHQETHPEITQVQLGKVLDDPAHVARKALVLEFKGHVDVDGGDEIELPVLVQQLLLPIRKGPQQQFPELQGPYVYDRAVQELVLIGKALRGRESLELVLHVGQVFLVTRDQVKAGRKDVTGHFCPGIGLKKTGHLAPFHDIDLQVVDPLGEKKLVVLHKKLVSKGLTGIGKLEAVMGDELLHLAREPYLNP